MKYIAHYENEDGYDLVEVIFVREGDDPFEIAYQECPSGYSLVYLTDDK
nr:MAG TPA: hypothetical protein [Caudoviricetes sp.]